MRIITLTVPDGVGFSATLIDEETGIEVDGVTKLIFNDLNPLELWTGTLVFLHAALEPEDVYLKVGA